MENLNKPKITVVVPIYNVEKYIYRCIDSILNQTFREFEIVLVDDGSPDNCGKICDDYVDICVNKGINCKVIHQENGGLSEARNSGIEWAINNSVSEWISFIDSDDWIIPEYFELLYNTANQLNVEIAIGNYDEVKRTEDIKQYDLTQLPQRINVEDFWINHRTNATVAWAKLYKKSSFEYIRYPKGKKHEDEYITYKLLFKQNEIGFIDIPIYHYFYNDSGISKSGYLKRLPDLLEAFNNHIQYFANKPWKKVYRLEIEMYAAAISDAIWILNSQEEKNNDKINELRESLKAFIKKYRSYIPFEKRKDIYIATYPKQTILIRMFGPIIKFLKKRFPLIIKFIRHITHILYVNNPKSGRKSIDRKNRKRLSNKNFSIISSNCTGGVIYHDLGLRFNSPFINLYILPDDYIKLLKNLKKYMNEELVEIQNLENNFPIGKVDDVTLYFLHYASFEEAKAKWEERKKRINYDNLFIIFCDRDGCTDDYIRLFDQLPYKHKICFTHTPKKQFKCTYYIKGFEKYDQIGVITDFKDELSELRYLDSFDYVKWLNS